MAKLLLFDVCCVSEDFFSSSVRLIRSFGDPVDEFRKTDRPFEIVVAEHEQQGFMNGIIPDRSAGLAHLLNARMKVERKDFCLKVLTCCTQRNNKTLKRETEHRARALRRTADDLLSLVESVSRIGRQVFGRLDLRKLRPDVLPVRPKVELLAVHALHHDNLVLVTRIRPDLNFLHAVFLPAVRANKFFLVRRRSFK